MEENKTPKPLTLQQKFVELRKAVPAIVQKQHSDGVKYKFAKIFDVYQMLTPAMNEHGVNFDIVGEKATRHAENGDDIYYHTYQQQTKNGTRTVWVYEADLTLRWTNADDPSDTQEVTLHAIGTNDGGPDKAKGSAWTYCLKYYFFEKFGIDQGEDDPDNVPKEEGGIQAPIIGGGAANNGPKPLSDAQLNRMYAKGEAAGYNREKVNKSIMQKYGQQEPRNLTKKQYEEVCKNLDDLKNKGASK